MMKLVVSIGLKVGSSIGSIFKRYGMKFVVIGGSIPVVSMIVACVMCTAVLSSNSVTSLHKHRYLGEQCRGCKSVLLRPPAVYNGKLYGC